MLSEAGIICGLQAAFSNAKGVHGIGDDAAVLPLDATNSYVITKDILVEHVHFRRSTSDAASLAHKALHVNLSDIAAMGAQALYVLMGIALPKTVPEAWVAEFMAEFTAACHAAKVQLIGGDTTTSDRDIFISITVMGRGENAHLKFRHLAKVGDVIAVAGRLGEACAGLVALEKNVAGLDEVKSRQVRPDALHAEGLWLGAETAVTAMMDVSDGLMTDLGRLAAASKAGAVVDRDLLLPSADLVAAGAALGLDACDMMLAGGEDYALLMTVDTAAYERVAAQFQKKFGYDLMRVGSIVAGGGVELRENGKPVALNLRPFSHFGEL